MIKNLCAALLLSASVSANAQDTENSRKFISVSGEAGFVLNSDMDKTFGLGGTVSYMVQDMIFNHAKNYVTVGLKGFSNPYSGGKFISNIGNNKNDGMNYSALLGGYRFIFDTVQNGWYVEPRLGVAMAGGNYFGAIIAPKAGLTYNNWDFAAFTDLSFGGENNLGKNSFATAGLGIGYIFGLSHKTSRRVN
ncbi:hypothetical protein [uncultured Chryseobacterium sp.]|uniref:hypothetical protein n=1 Tax=uncultured Chryseobacterium sp. TaxID=259322 RepID=UPI002601B43E|nr:hypothetical protein [uncultured Chryseobacterium sp.]